MGGGGNSRKYEGEEVGLLAEGKRKNRRCCFCLFFPSSPPSYLSSTSCVAAPGHNPARIFFSFVT